MKKYCPSVKNNNALKEEILSELNVVLYKLSKGKFDAALDKDAVQNRVAEIKEIAESLESAIGTGKENIGAAAKEIFSEIKNFGKTAEQSFTHRFENAAEDLSYSLVLLKDILDGNAVAESPEEIAKEKVTRTRRKLNGKLTELAEIKEEFVFNSKRLNSEISTLERDLAEYENAMLAEENERKINDLFRQIKAVKSKIDTLSARQGHYSACFNLLDMIYANAREILEAANYAAEEVSKAKVLLNIEKLKKVVVEPDKAVAILKRMETDIKEIAAKTVNMDNKVFGLDRGTTAVNNDALQYKEELMRKMREKEANRENLNDLQFGATEKTKETI